MNDNSIVLFDMDGTLTPARLPADNRMGTSLAKLSKYTKVGIVTGSDFDYLVQQCDSLWNSRATISPENLFLLPCNGTKFYSWSAGNWKLQKSVDMRQELGEEDFQLLMKTLITSLFTATASNFDLPLTGHFISYRDSMINWCPIGRNANNEQRKEFVEWDKKTGMRLKTVEKLEKIISNSIGENKICFALGGNTSIDIYPEGWDKTYALQYFPDYECWFVGDRCDENGNDKTIYDALSIHDKAFKTEGPNQTMEIIEEIISCLNPTLPQRQS